MGIYTPIQTWLAHQPTNIGKLPATFEQIEAVLSRSLPATARKKAQWWENNPIGHPQAAAWLAAGFETQTVSISSETVTFSRIQRSSARRSHDTRDRN
jgi:hypothetical protein